MSILLFALILATGGKPSDPPPPPPQEPTRSAPVCHSANLIPAVHREGSVRARRLGDEPAANLYLGVLRYEGKCEKPVMIRSDIGGARQPR